MLAGLALIGFDPVLWSLAQDLQVVQTGEYLADQPVFERFFR